jgi:hypothetical protein
MAMKSCMFWDVMPCSPRKVRRRFGGTQCLLLMDQRETKQILMMRTVRFSETLGNLYRIALQDGKVHSILSAEGIINDWPASMLKNLLR